MKTILGALTAIMLIGAVAAPSAEAACWAGPGGWHCWHPHYWHHAYYHHGWDRRW